MSVSILWSVSLMWFDRIHGSTNALCNTEQQRHRTTCGKTSLQNKADGVAKQNGNKRRINSTSVKVKCFMKPSVAFSFGKCKTL